MPSFGNCAITIEGLEFQMNLLELITAISVDIDNCFENADQLINMGYDPWRPLETVSSLDFIRRGYIQEAVQQGMSILAISGASRLSPNAIRVIIEQRTYQI